MKLFRLLVLFIFLASGGGIISLTAQDRVVSGKVFDTQEQPLVGAFVMIEGSNTGTTTIADGSFKLTIPQGNVSLNVRYLGYITQTIPISVSQTDLTVHLQEDIVALESVVVVGYGTQKRVNLTGAISVVGGKEFENRILPTLPGMLQGTVPGLNITTSSGRPGSTLDINIRGVTSINATEPLVLIDGAVGDLNRVTPSDVESISVIKDASAAAIYGARAAFGVILVTTKSGSAQTGKAIVRYSGRMGWQEPTASTDYENRGYWSVYMVNKFWQADSGTNYINYNDKDMEELWARVNDKTENPARPWVVTEMRNGRNQWVYYGNNDWWDLLFSKRRFNQQHSISLSGGSDNVTYMVSGSYLQEKGIQKHIPDMYNRFNLRSRIDFRINKWATLSSNTSLFSTKYTHQGSGGVDDTIGYMANHALACFPLLNPDGSGIYRNVYTTYAVGNGRQLVLLLGLHPSLDLNTDFSNTTRLVMTPLKALSITADFTYRFYQSRNYDRRNPFEYRQTPDGPMESYTTGAGLNMLREDINTNNYKSFNAFANYDETFGGIHHVSATGGFNYETLHIKNIRAHGENLTTPNINDLATVGTNASGQTITSVGGGQNEYALMGFFGRVNYGYKGRYLAEFSGRYDGTSRFASDSRWGLFPSASMGWRISEEPFFEKARNLVDNLKFRASFGSLGNQNVRSYYAYMRLVSISNLSYSFGEGTISKQSSLGAPLADNLTWETSQQWDLGIDLSMLHNRLNVTADVYIRDTKDMLTDGVALPAVYGANPPQMNAADLRTKGYEFAINWRDQFQVVNRPFEYSVGFNIGDYNSVITKYDNPERSMAKAYYEGMKLGEIWGFKTDGYFKTDAEAQQYAQEVNLSYSSSRLTGGWLAGDLKFLDLDGDGVWGIGANTVDNPGDRVILGNSLPSLSYGFNASMRWMGFDVSVLFQGTGTHHWYPSGSVRNFWGTYSDSYASFVPYNFIDKVWSEENPDTYFPRARAYSATGGYLSRVNDRYIQNIRYLRFKNLTVGYTIPVSLTKKAGIDQLRVYFSGENLNYWSPLKKNNLYVDPEAAFNRSNSVNNNGYYPWAKTFMFCLDVTF